MQGEAIPRSPPFEAKTRAIALWFFRTIGGSLRGSPSTNSIEFDPLDLCAHRGEKRSGRGLDSSTATPRGLAPHSSGGPLDSKHATTAPQAAFPSREKGPRETLSVGHARPLTEGIDAVRTEHATAGLKVRGGGIVVRTVAVLVDVDVVDPTRAADFADFARVFIFIRASGQQSGNQ